MMHRRLFVSLVLVFALTAAYGCAAKRSGPCAGPCAGPCGKGCNKPCKVDTSAWHKYGEPTKLAQADTVCVNQAMAKPDQYAGKYVRLCGMVDSVCAARGCWMRLNAPGMKDTLFVKFNCPIEGRLIPREAAGHRAIVEGTFEVKEISEAEARHYKEDAGASSEEIAKIVGPQKQIRLSAPAALVEGV